MIHEKYRAQVELLLRILPHVAEEKGLALKGGTAINLFERDMPRLSVDIDLTYTNADHDRTETLKNISDALGGIEKRIQSSIPGISLTRVPTGQGEDAKLNCQTREAHVKIEVNTITRGIIFPTRLMEATESVQNEFKKFAAIHVVSHGELFGGKICAALDRQHPRDLFDVYLLLKNEGITDEIKLGSITFMLSHARPMSELLSPHELDQRATFEKQFRGMTTIPFTYEDFEATRKQLIAAVRKSLTEYDIKFLLSFESGVPEWGLIQIDNLQNLPAVRWKLQNIRSLIDSNPNKHVEMKNALEVILG
ncbi:MAG: nucleotidyl transferase AbiEii/AbiGii toxin family protein [Cyclobacteriaceae bacterium]|jgi:predicted nucleotidyltransferase component of viral defense system